jgi:hypothetical protein
MITLTLTPEQARVLQAAIGTACNCYADHAVMADHMTLLTRIDANITSQLPRSSGNILEHCRVKYTVFPDSRNNGKHTRI